MNTVKKMAKSALIDSTEKPTKSWKLKPATTTNAFNFQNT